MSKKKRKKLFEIEKEVEKKKDQEEIDLFYINDNKYCNNIWQELENEHW